MNNMGRNSVDTRTMSLVFDNSKFETPAKNSLSLIERLKGALEASTHVRLFEDINRGVKSVTMEPLINAIDSVHVKMSMLDTMTDQWSRNFANSIERLAKSITIDQLTAGWSKYEDKTQAVQTIMAATADQWGDQGRQMEYVNRQLEKMNWFTDETSYDFVDMTSNVGKFINTGVKLDDAVTAMEGIATWAARSGANAQEASRAMYNLSQAMGSGKMQLTDWRSIELANMATMEFRRTVLKTAKELGKLKEVGDGVYETLDGKATVTAETIRDDLKAGWFTSDVIVETLKKYGDFANALNKSISNLKGKVAASQMLTWIKQFKAGAFDAEAAAREAGVSVESLSMEVEHLSDASYDFGREAFQAAQEAKTFTDAINYTKDAASSAWMNIYESLFGNYLDQKGLWTDLAEHMYEAFIKPIEDIGDTITVAFEKEAIIGEREWNLLKENGIVSDDFIDEIIKAGKMFGYITSDMVVDADNFVSTLEDGWFTADLFDKIFEYNGKGMAKFSDTIDTGITDVREFLKLAEILRHSEVLGGEPENWGYDFKAKGFNEAYYTEFVRSVAEDYENLKELEGDSAAITDEMINKAAAAVLSMQYGREVTVDEVNSIIDALNEEATSYDKAAESAKGLAKVAVDKTGKETVARLEGSYYWSEALTGSMDALTEFFTLLGERAAEVFGEPGSKDVQSFAVDIYNLVNRVLDLIENSETLRSILDTVFSIVKIKASVAIAKFIILRDTAKGLVNVITSFAEGLTGKKKTIGEVAKMLGDAASKFAKWLNDSKFISNAFDIIASIAGVAGISIREFIDSFIGLDKVTDTAGNVRKGLIGTLGDIGKFIGGLAGSFKEFKDQVASVDDLTLDDLRKAFEETVGAFVGNFEGFDDIKTAFSNLKKWVKDTLKGVGLDTDNIVSSLKRIFGIGEETRDVWLDGTGWYRYDPGKHTFLGIILEALEGTYRQLKEFVSSKVDDLLSDIFGTSEYRQKIESGEIDFSSEDTFLGKLLLALKYAYDAIKDFLTDQVIDPLSRTWDNIIAFFKGDKMEINDEDDTFLGRIFEMLQKGFQNVSDFFAQGDALDFANWAGSALEKALFFLQDLINGFVNWAAGIHWMKLTMTMLNIKMAIDAAGGIKGMKDIIDVLGETFELFTHPFTAIKNLIKEFKAQNFRRTVVAIAVSLYIMAQALYTVCEKIDENSLLNGIITIGILGLFLVTLSQAMSLFSANGMSGASIGQSIPFLVIAYAVKMLTDVLDTITDMVTDHDFDVVGAIALLGGLESLLLAFSEVMSLFENAGMPGATFGQVAPLIVVAFTIKMMASILKSITELLTKDGANVGYALMVIGGLEALIVAISEVMSLFSNIDMPGAKLGQVVPMLAIALTLKAMASVLKAVTELVKESGVNVAYGLAVISGLEALIAAVSEVMSLFSNVGMPGAKLGQVIPLLAIALTLKAMASVLKSVTELVKESGVNVAYALAIIGGLEALIAAVSEVMSLFSNVGMPGAKLGQVMPLLAIAFTLKMMAKVLKAVTELVSTEGVNTGYGIGVISALEGLLLAFSEIMSLFSNIEMPGAKFGQVAPLLVVALTIKMLAGVVKSLARVEDSNKLAIAVEVVVVLGLLLVALSELMSLFNNINMVGGGFGQMLALMPLAFAIRGLGDIVKALAKVEDAGKLWSAVGVVGVLGLLLIGLNTVMGSTAIITTGWDIAGILFATGCILILAHAVGELATLDIDSVWNATVALSVLTVVFTLCANFMPTAAKASSGLFAMVGLTLALAVIVGALSRLGGDHVLDAAMALALGIGTMIVAAYALAGIGAIAPALATGAAVLLAVVGILLIIGALMTQFPDVGEEITKSIENAKAFMSGLGEMLGGFVGGFIGGATEEYTKHLPKIGRFIKQFTLITSQIKADKFEEGCRKLERMGEVLKGITFDTLWGGIANLMGKVEEYDDEGNVTKEVNIWEQFADRAETIATALTRFQEQIDTVANIEIPLDEVEALSLAIKSLPFEKDGFLSWFTGSTVADETDIANFERAGTSIAKAIGAFNVSLPDDLDVEKVTAASQAVMAISTLGRLIAELMGGDLESLFKDRKMPEAFDIIGTALSTLSNKQYNLDNLDWITTSTDSISKLLESVSGIKLPKGDLSDSDSVTTVVGNITSLVSTIVDYSDTKFDAASRIQEMCEKLNSIALSGDVADEDKVAAFTDNVRDLSDVFEEVAEAYVDTTDTSGASSIIDGQAVEDMINNAVGNVFGDLSPEKLKQTAYEAAGLDANGGGGDLFAQVVGGLFGFDENGNPPDLTSMLYDEDGNDIFGIGEMVNELKGDFDSLAGDFGENGKLGAAIKSVKDSFTGENGLTNEIKSVSSTLASLGSEDGEAMAGINNLYERVNDLRTLLGVDASDEKLAITPVINSDQYYAQLSEIKSATSDAFSPSQNLAGLIQASIDLSPLENAIYGLKTDNQSNFAEMERLVNNLSIDVQDLGRAMSDMQMILDTGALVGHITPMVNRELGYAFSS